MDIAEIHTERQRELYREIAGLGIPSAYIGNPLDVEYDDGWGGALAVGWAEWPDYLPVGPQRMLILRMPDGTYLREASGRVSQTPQSFDTLRDALALVRGTDFPPGGMFAVVRAHEPGRLAQEAAHRAWLAIQAEHQRMQPVLRSCLPVEVAIVFEPPYAGPGCWRLFADPAAQWLGRLEWRAGEGRYGNDTGAQRALTEWQRTNVLPDSATILRIAPFEPVRELLPAPLRYKDFGPNRWVVRVRET